MLIFCSALMLYPPIATCFDPACTASKDTRKRKRDEAQILVQPSEYAITLFTQSHGALPGKVISLYCPSAYLLTVYVRVSENISDCKTRYHHNYYVHHSATVRTYYSIPPSHIQVAEHAYVTAELCEFFATMMAIGG